MTRTRNSYRRMCGYLPILLVAAIAWFGCGEESPQDQTAMLIDHSKSPSIQTALSGDTMGITVKYLPPRFLAAAEYEGGTASSSLDSLTELYSQSMNFTISVKHRGEIAPETDFPTTTALLSDELQNFFWIESGNSVHVPFIAQLEHNDAKQRRYFVVFDIDPRRTFAAQDTLVFAFANPLGASGISRFRFPVKDILQSPDVIAQLTQ